MAEPTNLTRLDKELAKFTLDENGDIAINIIPKIVGGLNVETLLDKEMNKFELDSLGKVCVRTIIKDYTVLDGRYLKLDQSTPQTITASPYFNWLTAGRIPFVGTNKVLADSSAFLYDSTKDFMALKTSIQTDATAAFKNIGVPSTPSGGSSISFIKNSSTGYTIPADETSLDATFTYRVYSKNTSGFYSNSYLTKSATYNYLDSSFYLNEFGFRINELGIIDYESEFMLEQYVPYYSSYGYGSTINTTMVASFIFKPRYIYASEVAGGTGQYMTGQRIKYKVYSAFWTTVGYLYGWDNVDSESNEVEIANDYSDIEIYYDNSISCDQYVIVRYIYNSGTSEWEYAGETVDYNSGYVYDNTYNWNYDYSYFAPVVYSLYVNISYTNQQLDYARFKIYDSYATSYTYRQIDTSPDSGFPTYSFYDLDTTISGTPDFTQRYKVTTSFSWGAATGASEYKVILANTNTTPFYNYNKSKSTSSTSFSDNGTILSTDVTVTPNRNYSARFDGCTETINGCFQATRSIAYTASADQYNSQFVIDTVSGDTTGRFLVTSGSTNKFLLNAQALRPIQFIEYTNQGFEFTCNTSTRAMSIAPSGKVGIRTITSPTAAIHLPPNTITAGTAPIKFSNASNLMTTKEAGAFETLGGYMFFTDQAGTTRRRLIMDNGTDLTAGRIPFCSTLTGILTDDAALFFDTGAKRLGVGTVSPASRLHVLNTGEQARFGYDSGNYFTISVASNGTVTFDTVGTTQQFNFSDDIKMGNLKNLIWDTTNGTKLGTGTTQKMGFWNATPIVQPANTVAIDDVLVNTGLRASGGVSNHSTQVTAPTAKIGGVSDYTEFESDGTMVAKGNATTTRDEKNDALNLKVTGVGISQNATEGVTEYLTSSDLNDWAIVNVQLNHDRELTSNIFPHIHWFQAQNNNPNFLLEYRWQINGGSKVTSWTLLKCNTLVHTYSTGTIHQISKTASGIAVPVGTTLSDIVQFRIYRDNANNSTQFTGSDAYNATVGILSFDVHVVCDTLGSRTEYSK